MDREHLEYNLREIRKHKGIPFQMGEELAEEQIPYIRAAFPEAQMVRYQNGWYIIVSNRARAVLINLLGNLKAKHEQAIKELENVIGELESAREELGK